MLVCTRWLFSISAEPLIFGTKLRTSHTVFRYLHHERLLVPAACTCKSYFPVTNKSKFPFRNISYSCREMLQLSDFIFVVAYYGCSSTHRLFENSFGRKFPRYLSHNVKFYCQNASEPEKKPSLLQRFKQMYKDYWYVLVPVHLVTSAFWFTSFYYLTKRYIHRFLC